jgi:hypothetical protein
MNGLTVFELAARHGRSVAYMAQLLEDERRRGNAEQLPNGRWTASASARAKFGPAFQDLGPIHHATERRHP